MTDSLEGDPTSEPVTPVEGVAAEPSQQAAPGVATDHRATVMLLGAGELSREVTPPRAARPAG